MDTKNREYNQGVLTQEVFVTKKVMNKNYSKEFKLEAIKLAMDSGSIAKTARDLGVSDKALYYWISQYKQDQKTAFPGKGHLKPQDEEMRELRLEVKRLKEANDILKKAATYFAKEMK